MPDRVFRGLNAQRGLRVVFARVTEMARLGRMLHGLYPTSARLFAKALAAGTLLGALQKRDEDRVNLQLECDGPVGGLLVDAGAGGDLRGYVRHGEVHFPGDPERGLRAALGSAGHLTVLRPMADGSYYRSTVQLQAFELTADLRHWFTASEQVASALDLAVLPSGDEPLGEVAGILFQRLPDGDELALQGIRALLEEGAFPAALARDPHAQAVVAAVAGRGFELVADQAVEWRCPCDHARARAAVSALGVAGLDEVLAAEKRAVIDCQFCRKRYTLEEAELREIREKLAAQGPGSGPRGA